MSGTRYSRHTVRAVPAILQILVMGAAVNNNETPAGFQWQGQDRPDKVITSSAVRHDLFVSPGRSRPKGIFPRCLSRVTRPSVVRGGSVVLNGEVAPDLFISEFQGDKGF
jgi:hypothetical protein